VLARQNHDGEEWAFVEVWFDRFARYLIGFDLSFARFGQVVPPVGITRFPPDDLDTGPPIYAGRPRLRAVWTEWSAEVRVLAGA
jgi:hypothetical protein